MPTVSKVFTPQDIFQGPADVYLGVLAPPSAVPPVQFTNTLQLDNFGQPPIGATGQIATVTVSAGGSGYSVGDTLTIVQSGGIAGMVRVITAPAGVVGTVTVIRGGQGYSAAASLATTGGTGTGCTITIATITAGFHIGISEGPAQFSVAPKYELIKGDQFSVDIDAALISMETEIDFIVKEMQLILMQQLFTGLFSATAWSLTVGGTNPAADFVTIGNTNSSQALVETLTLVSPRRDFANKFVYAMAYRAFIKSAIQFNIGRPKENMWKLKFHCLADMTRVAKDRVMQVVRTL